jgi:hypothetical protein
MPGSGTRAPLFAASDRSLPKQTETAVVSVERQGVPPLFDPRTEWSILALSLATVEAEGDVDVERLVNGLTFRQPLPRRLPRRPVETLRRGVHVVLDRRPAMMPFFGDQDETIAALRSVAGIDRVVASSFDRVPALGHPLTGAETAVAGTPVLLLSDLGVGQPPFSPPAPPPPVWLSFSRSLERAGCQLLVFFPYELERCPPELVGRLRIVRWDRKTTVSAARRARMRETRATI